MFLRNQTILIGLAVSPAVFANSPEAGAATQLDEVVVTAAPTTAPLTVTLDPRATYQPAPAADGAGLLKAIPGFNVTRKGGSGGDPLFRGLGGGRLDIQADGTGLYGGCGGRMDPPTAYLNPETFDRVTLLKGPQTVKHGPVAFAGTVLFEREAPAFVEPGIEGQASLLIGRDGRVDSGLNFSAGSSQAYVRISTQTNDSDDYHDGNGNAVHSESKRRAGSLTIGITPTENTTLEASYDISRAEAAYADRGMDGSKFDRNAWNLKFEQRNLTSWLNKVGVQVFRSYVDHVMDNYTFRSTPKMKQAAMNPDRTVTGGRAYTQFAVGEGELDVGFDWQDDQHRSRMGMMGADYHDKPYAADMSLERRGVYGELSYPLATRTRLIAGLRRDRDEARDDKQLVNGTANPNYGVTQRNNLDSGFIRLEQRFTDPLTLYAGFGHAERGADYWERNARFNLKPETLNQLDVGALWQGESLSASLSLFAGRIDDYILVDYRAAKTTARNVDANRRGGEADVKWRFLPGWTLGGALAYVWAENDSEGRPLGQTPPLEGRVTLNYDNDRWSAGGLWRVVAAQDRVDIGTGNIIGRDLGTTPGFATLSINAGYKPLKNLQLTAGIDNLFDRTYAESVSKAGAMVAGYEQTSRVNEPGRTWWVKGQYRF